MPRPSLLIALAAAPALAQPATFRALGLFGPQGTPIPPNSHGTAVSSDGSVVAGNADAWESFHGVIVSASLRWTAQTGWQQLPIVGYGGPFAISFDGSTIAGSADLLGLPIMQSAWVIRGVSNPVSAPVYAGGFKGISGDGLTAVGWANIQFTDPVDPIAWTQASGVRSLGHIPGATAGYATAANADGAVIVGYDGGSLGQAFIWTASQGIRGLGFLPGAASTAHSRAYGVSADGRAVVGLSTNSGGSEQGFLWRAEYGMVPFNLLDGYVSGAARAVSADGSVVVGSVADAVNHSIAYYWDRARGRRDLRQFLITLGATGLTGWTLTSANAVSPDGSWIVGDGTDPQGNTQAWLAHIPAFCYANCDGSTWPPILTVNDFTCFQTRFAAGDAYADCDQSSAPPLINIADFICFQQHFAAGCP
jgi:probable HAF family extracellular repeat protein